MLRLHNVFVVPSQTRGEGLGWLRRTLFGSSLAMRFRSLPKETARVVGTAQGYQND